MIPILARPSTIAIASAYFLVNLGIGAWAMNRTRTPRDFFVAGQNLGLLVTAMAAMSASFSGFVFLGGPGLTYRIGVSSLFINLPVAFTASMTCWLLAKRLRLLAEAREIFTLPDAIAARFQSASAAAVAAVAIALGTIGYLASQVLALGRLLEAIFGTRTSLGTFSLPVAMAAGLAVVLLYSLAGGMIAGVYTDLVQGALMLATSLAVFHQALQVGGGAREILGQIVHCPRFGPSFLEPFGLIPPLTALGFFFVFSVGTLGQPHVLHKFLMLKDPRQLKWMPLVIMAAQTTCLLVWIGIGLLIPSQVASGRIAPLEQPDDAAATFLLLFAPELLAGLMLAGILAAIMSTADSFLNIGAAALVRDLPRAWGRAVGDELRWARLAMLAVAAASLLLAWSYNDLVALLGTFAFGTFAAALAPVLAIGLNWKRVSAGAATASMLTGVSLNLGLEFLNRQTLFETLPRVMLASGALPSAVALAGSLTVLLVVSWLRPARNSLPADITLVMDA